MNTQRLAYEADRIRQTRTPCETLPVVTDGKAGLGKRPELSLLLRNKTTGDLTVDGGIEMETYARWLANRIEREGTCEVVALVVRWVNTFS